MGGARDPARVCCGWNGGPSLGLPMGGVGHPTAGVPLGRPQRELPSHAAPVSHTCMVCFLTLALAQLGKHLEREPAGAQISLP